MFSHNSGIVDPFGYTIALAENAHANGVEYHFGCEVTAIRREDDDTYEITTTKGNFKTRWVVNCAGLAVVRSLICWGSPATASSVPREITLSWISAPDRFFLCLFIRFQATPIWEFM